MSPLEQQRTQDTVDAVKDQQNGTSVSSEDSISVPTQDSQNMQANSELMTRQQADQILTEIKSIKQNIFWVLLIAGFFVARSVLFHY